MQDNLLRPSDPVCVGVVCFLGERIGYPLRDFSVTRIPGWADWSDPKRRFRAVHPWPDDQEEQLQQVMAGGFPVSGTVFEVLDSLGAGRPTYTCYLADRDVTFHDPDVSFNNGQWRATILRGLDTGEASHWLMTEYLVQTKAVSNFLNSLNDRSRYVPRHRTVDEAITGVCNFVKANVAPDTLIEENPYRSLDFYDIYDSDDLHGREQKTHEATDELRARSLGESGRPAITRITGVSGCGKTSFLRAGILGQLNRPRELGRFKVLAVRPTDFHDDSGHPAEVLIKLLGLIAIEIRDFESIPEASISRLRRASHRAPEVAVTILTQALERLPTKDSWLVVGLDQFEEILDDLAAAKQRRYASQWIPLLSFVTAAVRAKARIAFVYTLESSRYDLLSRDFVPEALREAHEVRLGGDDEAFLELIITKPFERAGYYLAPKIVNELLASYKKYVATMQGSASALPLLSLKLSNLFDFIQYLPRRADRHVRPEGVLWFTETSINIPYEDVKDHLRLDNDIEELANEAWGEHDKPEDERIDNLDRFLQPLIALGGANFDTLTLLTVGDSNFVNFSKKLESFLERRLIIRDNGRRRLVHEAVVRQWPLASKWLAYKRQYLIREARFRHEADYWVALGKEADAVPADEASIETSVAILRSYFQEWPFANDADLTAESRNLRDYCQAILANSPAPAKPYTRYFRSAMSPVHVAAGYGMTDLVGRFTERDSACLTVLDGRKRTALDQASWVSASTTRLLVEKGANPINFDQDYWSPLAAPVWTGNTQIFQVLAPHYKTRESVKCPQGSNLLHVAAMSGACEMAHTLIHQIPDLDPSQPDNHGRTPLHYAALKDQPDAFEFFLAYCDPTAKDSGGFTVLHLAAANGNNRVLDVILGLPEFYPLVESVALDGRTALMHAAINRHTATVSRLCTVMDPNQQVQVAEGQQNGWTALHFAISGPAPTKRETRTSRQQALRTVRALLEVPTIDPNIRTSQGQTPISLAASIPLVQRELVAHGSFAWPELPEGATPLNFLIKTKDRYLVEKMLQSGDLDVEALSANGDYAVSLLIKNGMPDLAIKLWDEGRVHPWRIQGTPDNGMRAAVSEDNRELIERFLQTLPQPLEPYHRRQLGLVVRNILYESHGREFLPRILELGVDVDAVDKMGWTIFHLAALLGDPGAFDAFVTPAARTDKADEWGRTPPDLVPDASRVEFETRFANSVHASQATTASGAGDIASAYLSFDGPEWHNADQPDIDAISAIGPIDGRLSIGSDAQIRWRDLPMFSDVKLFQITDRSWLDDLRICYLAHNGEFYRLNGTSPPIHEVRGKAKISLTVENVLFYLSFFCFFVRGEEGPFYVLHSADDPLLPTAFAGGQAEGTPKGRTPAHLLRSPRLTGTDSDGNFRVSSLVYYSDAVFHADMVVHLTGTVDMVEDVPLIAELPCKLQAPLIAPVLALG